jgi:hypothetical protein
MQVAGLKKEIEQLKKAATSEVKRDLLEDAW